MRRSTFGFVFQRFNLIRGLTVLDNVMLPAYPTGPGLRPSCEARALGLLAQFAMESKLADRVEWLSGGEAQRTAICRALINEPRHPDRRRAHGQPGQQAVAGASWRCWGICWTCGRTVLVSSHDPQVFESARVYRVVKMRDGLVAGESPC